VFASLVLLVFAHSLGYWNAKNQEDYFVLADTPDHVVAAMDDDMIILAAYDPAVMRLKRSYTIRRLTSERVWLLEKKHIGKLSEPAPLIDPPPPPPSKPPPRATTATTTPIATTTTVAPQPSLSPKLPSDALVKPPRP